MDITGEFMHPNSPFPNTRGEAAKTKRRLDCASAGMLGSSILLTLLSNHSYNSKVGRQKWPDELCPAV